MGLLVLCAGAAVPAQATGPLDFYYERSLMAAAGARCNLFNAQIRAALEAASAQARSAALRAGRSEPDVAAVRERAAAKAEAVPCGSPDLTVAAGRVRSAFEGWSKLTRITYPGADGGWTADRALYRSPTWRLVETSGQEAAFGLAGDESAPQALAAVLAESGRGTPYGARLKFRDTSRAPLPWLAHADALPPASALRTVFAEAKAPAAPSLARRDGPATAFRFPAAAADALAALDPREHFEVEFLYAHDRVRTATFEVGDFAAGRAFLAMGPR